MHPQASGLTDAGHRSKLSEMPRSLAIVGSATMMMPPSMEPIREIPEILPTMIVALHLEMESVLALVSDSDGSLAI